MILEQGYDGEWRDDRQHGRGTYYWPNGQYYDGEWNQSHFQGRGTFKYPNGLRVTGQWEKGKLILKH
jgi:hypothetical protein